MSRIAGGILLGGAGHRCLWPAGFGPDADDARRSSAPPWRQARLAVAILLICSAPAAAALRAGAYAVESTPRTFPISISGGFLPRYASKAPAPLHIRVVALDDGGVRLAIAIADTLFVPRELADRAKRRASVKTGIPPERMLVAATHTHSAPPLAGALGTDEDPAYAAYFEERLVEAIEGAAARMQPARAGWISVDDFAHTYCRRWILRPDRLRMDPFGDLTIRANMHPGYQNPDFIGPSGPADPGLSMFSVQTPEGRPIALLANYSMHYIGADPVSPDYFGAFSRQMEQLIRPDGNPEFVAMMSQGTSGDQMWMNYGEPARKTSAGAYAEEMAAIAHAAYKRIEYRSAAPLAMAETKLALSRRLPDERRLTWAARVMAARNGKPPSNQPEVLAREQFLVAASPARELILQAVRIGDFGITAIPNEVFAITGLKLKARSPLALTMNIELANGCEGYIPPPEQHELGGYTTWIARSAGLEVEAEPKIVEAVLTLLEQVAGKPRRPAAHVNGPYASAVLAAGPLAYWRGHEMEGRRAFDAGPRGHHGVYEGGVALYLEGPPSRAFSGTGFNRAPHFAGGRMAAALADLGAAYTVEMWLWNGLPADARDIAGWLYSRDGEALGIGGGRLFFTGGGVTLRGGAEIPLKTWAHVALARNGRGVRVYLDGVPAFSGDADAVPGGSARVFLGGHPGGAGSFAGKLDEIAIYPRALGAADIAARYALGAR
jgi:hypothetical protein